VKDHATIEPRAVGPTHGWTWISVALELFKRAPGPWIATFAIWSAIYLLATLVPLGTLAATLAGAVFMGGCMIGCRAQDRGGRFRIEHLFDGFRSEQLGPLVVVGATYLGGTIVAMLIVALIFPNSMMPLLFARTDPMRLHLDLQATIGLLLLAGLMAPLLMALWFAPALVVFHNYPSIEAMKASFNACWRNLPAFLLYGIVVFALTIVAILPLLLGLLVLGPIVIASIYTSYCDIFEAAGAQPLREAPASGGAL